MEHVENYFYGKTDDVKSLIIPFNQVTAVAIGTQPYNVRCEGAFHLAVSLVGGGQFLIQDDKDSGEIPASKFLKQYIAHLHRQNLKEEASFSYQHQLLIDSYNERFANGEIEGIN